MPYVTTDVVIGGAAIKQVVSTSTRTGAVVRNAKYSGGAVIQQMYGVKLEQVSTIVSTDVGSLVALNTSTFVSAGLPLLSSTITVPFKNRANGATFQSGTNHSQITGSNALLIPTSIEAQQDSEQGATATVEVHWISADGVTSAYTGSAGVAIAAEAINVEFALGPADINGTDIASVTGIRVNPGLTLVKTSQAGGIMPVEVSIQMIEPTIDLTVHDIDEVIALTDAFTALSSFECYLRKRSDGGVYVADITAEHIKFSFADGIIQADTIESPETGNGSTTIRLYGETLTASAASAIT